MPQNQQEETDDEIPTGGDSAVPVDAEFAETVETYVLRLYVTGMTPRSSQAIATIKSLCEEHLAGRYDLEVIDIYQQPALAKDEQIIATPTLIKKLPAPLRRFIGDLSDEERILFRLDLRRKT